jgi:HEAT repeat protein
MEAFFGLDHAGAGARGAIPVLTEALDSRDDFTRNSAADSLAHLGANAKATIPVLIAELNIKPLGVIQACEDLALYGKDAAPAVPALRETMKDSDFIVRASAAQALCRIGGPEKEAAVDVLVKAFATPAFHRHELLVAGMLCSVDPSNPKAVEALRAALSDPAPSVRVPALIGCDEAGPGAKDLLPMLEQVMDSEVGGVRLEAARAVWKVGGRPEKAVAALVDCLKDPTYAGLRSRAAGNLGAIGADAKAAAEVLREALKDRDQYVRFAAAEALRKIDPDAADKAGIP